MEAANTLVNSENVFGQLLAALRRHGLDFTGREEQLCQSEIFHRAFEECERRCEPKRGSLDSIIMFAADDVLVDAHFVLATELFPEEEIEVARPPGSADYDYAWVFLCKQRLAFDSQGYCHHKQGSGAGFACPQPNLSDLVGAYWPALEGLMWLCRLWLHQFWCLNTLRTVG